MSAFVIGWLFAPAGEAPRMQVACIGSACVDRSYIVRGAVLGSSNPAQRGAALFGGVARNVCENLVRLGVDAALVSVVGSDARGGALIAELAACGANVDLVNVIEGPTDEYVAVLDAGELVIGAADTRAIDSFSVRDLGRVWSALEAASWIFAECNLSDEVLRECVARCANARAHLALDAVSAPKAQRLPARLDGIDLLLMNEGEARSYLGKQQKAEDLAFALLERGARSAVVTCGERGAVCADETGLERVGAPAARRVCETGAGDALAAGMLQQLLAGSTLRNAVRAGCELAARTLESERSVAIR